MPSRRILMFNRDQSARLSRVSVTRARHALPTRGGLSGWRHYRCMRCAWDPKATSSTSWCARHDRGRPQAAQPRVKSQDSRAAHAVLAHVDMRERELVRRPTRRGGREHRSGDLPPSARRVEECGKGDRQRRGDDSDGDRYRVERACDTWPAGVARRAVAKCRGGGARRHPRQRDESEGSSRRFQ